MIHSLSTSRARKLSTTVLSVGDGTRVQMAQTGFASQCRVVTFDRSRAGRQRVFTICGRLREGNVPSCLGLRLRVLLLRRGKHRKDTIVKKEKSQEEGRDLSRIVDRVTDDVISTELPVSEADTGSSTISIVGLQ